MLAELFRDWTRASDLSANLISLLVCQLSVLAARLVSAVQHENGGKERPSNDRLLTPAEAAAKLGLSRDWLYRNARKLPLTVRVSHRNVRFSEQGIERYIRQRQGR